MSSTNGKNKSDNAQVHERGRLILNRLGKPTLSLQVDGVCYRLIIWRSFQPASSRASIAEHNANRWRARLSADVGGICSLDCLVFNHSQENPGRDCRSTESRVCGVPFSRLCIYGNPTNHRDLCMRDANERSTRLLLELTRQSLCLIPNSSRSPSVGCM